VANLLIIIEDLMCGEMNKSGKFMSIFTSCNHKTNSNATSK
jgi:hypothetical protein